MLTLNKVSLHVPNLWVLIFNFSIFFSFLFIPSRDRVSNTSEKNTRDSSSNPYMREAWNNHDWIAELFLAPRKSLRIKFSLPIWVWDWKSEASAQAAFQPKCMNDFDKCSQWKAYGKVVQNCRLFNSVRRTRVITL